jgi:hypothetical protein
MGLKSGENGFAMWVICLLTSQISTTNLNQTSICPFLFSMNLPYVWHIIKVSMAKKDRKPTNKAKFSIYVDKTVMQEVAKTAQKMDRSINWLVEKRLSGETIL